MRFKFSFQFFGRDLRKFSENILFLTFSTTVNTNLRPVLRTISGYSTPLLRQLKVWCQYNNIVHLEGVRFICGPHLVMNLTPEKMNIITIITHFCRFTPT